MPTALEGMSAEYLSLCMTPDSELCVSKMEASVRAHIEFASSGRRECTCRTTRHHKTLSAIAPYPPFRI